MLGDWVAGCLGCGFAQRYFEEYRRRGPPECGGEMRSQLPQLRRAVLASAFAVECEACGGEWPPESSAYRIRRA